MKTITVPGKTTAIGVRLTPLAQSVLQATGNDGPRWWDLVRLSIWGGDGTDSNQNYGVMAEYPPWHLIYSLSDITGSPAYYFSSFTGYDGREGIASAFYGRENTHRDFDITRSWRPSKVRIEWEPADLPVQFYAWDDYFWDIAPDWETTYTSPAEIPLTYYAGDQYHTGRLEYMGVENNADNNTPFKITRFEAFGDNPAYYYLDPSKPVSGYRRCCYGKPPAGIHKRSAIVCCRQRLDPD